MANRSRQTFIKRQKERARQEKQRIKAERRVQRNTDRVKLDATGEDPDLLGMVPGPQKLAWELMDVLTDADRMAIEEEQEAAKKKAEEKAAGG